MISAGQALERLREGNRRFAAGANDASARRVRPADLVGGQNPFAIVLGCSDSRVPAEIIFDQGLGDLFVIRVAGNIVAPSQIGSVEFAVSQFGARLVVVLGHSQCGAVLATLEQLGTAPAGHTEHVGFIVDNIRAAIEPVLVSKADTEADELTATAVRANIRASAYRLRHGSQVLEQLIASDGLMVVGAEYSLESGTVSFFDGAPKSV